MSIQGYKSLIKGESSQIAFTDEATTTSDDLSYQITDTAKQIFAFDSTIVVKDAGVVTTEDYTVNRLEGTVTFATATTRDITLSGNYVVLSTVAEAKSFSFDGSTDMLDSTIFQESTRTFVPGLIGATISIGRFYNIDRYFIDYLYAGAVIVVEIYADISDDPFRFYAIVADDGVASTVEGLTEETVKLQVTDKMIVEV